MTRKLLVEGYRPSGKEVVAVRGYQVQPRPASKPAAPPKPPKATSAVARPKG